MQTLEGIVRSATQLIIIAGIAYWAYLMFFGPNAITKEKGMGGLFNTMTGIVGVALVVAAVTNIATGNAIGNAAYNLLLSILTGV